MITNLIMLRVNFIDYRFILYVPILQSSPSYFQQFSSPSCPNSTHKHLSSSQVPPFLHGGSQPCKPLNIDSRLLIKLVFLHNKVLLYLKVIEIKILMYHECTCLNKILKSASHPKNTFLPRLVQTQQWQVLKINIDYN